jgi:hypothetical protein
VEQSPSDKLTTAQVKKFLDFHGTRRSTTYHPTSLRYILILPFHVLRSTPSDIYISGFLTKILRAFLTFLMFGAVKIGILAHVFCPEHLVLKLKNQRDIRGPKKKTRWRILIDGPSRNIL